MAEPLIVQARAEHAVGNLEAAAELTSKVLANDPKDAAARTLRAQIYDSQRRYDDAVRDLDVLLADNPLSAEANYRRAVANFCRGKIKAANADFEIYLKLRPADRPYRWEYGISLYYAGRFQDGADLFASHQTVNSHDVENAAWRFLCMARVVGIEKARKDLIPIEGDFRVPMSEIYQLYRGELKPDDVFAAAERGEVSDAQRKRQRFYAHLYVGLYFEADGKPQLAAQHLREADKLQVSDYMWDVAHVHVARLAANGEPNPSP